MVDHDDGDRDGAGAPAPDGGGGHPSRHELRAHLEDGLAPARAGEVDRHLDTCVACGAVLEDLAPAVPLDGPRAAPSPALDERRMRRAVRRTVVRTAGWAALLLVVGVIVFQLAAELLWHPLAVDRGDRVDDAVTASIDLPIVTVPGAQLDQYVSNVEGFRRVTEVEVSRAVGARVTSVGRYETTLGPWAAQTRDRFGWGPRLADDAAGFQDEPFDPERLDGLAVTVLHVLDQPLDDDGALEELAIDDDVALTWVGFAPGLGDELAPGPLGYSACTDPTAEVGRMSGSSGFGSAGLFRAAEPGVEHARAEFRRAADAITASGLVAGPTPDGLGDALTAVAGRGGNDDLPIDSFVLTGSAAVVAEVLAGAPAGAAYLVDVGFDTGPPESCG